MTDLLSGLRNMVPDRRYALDELTGTQAYEWALNDVREALRNPTDEQVERLAAIAWAATNEWRPAHEDLWELVVRTVLAAVAGGDDD